MPLLGWPELIVPYRSLPYGSVKPAVAYRAATRPLPDPGRATVLAPPATGRLFADGGATASASRPFLESLTLNDSEVNVAFLGASYSIWRGFCPETVEIAAFGTLADTQTGTVQTMGVGGGGVPGTVTPSRGGHQTRAHMYLAALVPFHVSTSQTLNAAEVLSISSYRLNFDWEPNRVAARGVLGSRFNSAESWVLLPTSMTSVVPDIDENALRRTQSVGDIDPTLRPSRLRVAPWHSDSASPGELLRPRTALTMASSHNASADPMARRPQSPPPPWAIPPMVFGEGRPQADHTQQEQERSILMKVLRFLGYAGPDAKARRELISLIWTLCFGFIQVRPFSFQNSGSEVCHNHHIAGIRRTSSEPHNTRRDRMGRVRAPLVSSWSWRREREIREIQARRQDGRDPESGQANSNAAPAGAGPNRYASSRATTSGASRDEAIRNLSHSQLYGRLSILTSFVSVTWFLTAHILEYTSVNTCRFSSPHLWWLTFAILCILYLMILEIFLLGLVVFILGPVIYLLWSIMLLCLGRHPIQNAHYIKPEIGKLPKSVVDQIPLVLYIPSPPDADESPAPTSQRKRRFAFFRLKKNKGDAAGTKKGKGSAAGQTKGADAGNGMWEDMWEAGGYPFVRLEGNRASCAICLMDFEEPRKAVEAAQSKPPKEKNVAEVVDDAESAAAQEIQVEQVTEEERNELQLDDAGEGPQPLRLLSCGHAFHQMCLDPWLTDVSGRCPICQRPVEPPEPSGKKSKRNRRTP
ncbi:hypothetical protein A0H81_12756 [Grifola frondosa]|uniref:RING-type domain-containing protein n=1 Tax=Grifola frondosa TaxID=5627 RepID=A0A1C7LR01_GRIFR|nr:hypothetical protein A0H81_12756 [Grifola frondosa]